MKKYLLIVVAISPTLQGSSILRFFNDCITYVTPYGAAERYPESEIKPRKPEIIHGTYSWSFWFFSKFTPYAPISRETRFQNNNDIAAQSNSQNNQNTHPNARPNNNNLPTPQAELDAVLTEQELDQETQHLIQLNNTKKLLETAGLLYPNQAEQVSVQDLENLTKAQQDEFNILEEDQKNLKIAITESLAEQQPYHSRASSSSSNNDSGFNPEEMREAIEESKATAQQKFETIFNQSPKETNKRKREAEINKPPKRYKELSYDDQTLLESAQEHLAFLKNCKNVGMSEEELKQAIKDTQQAIKEFQAEASLSYPQQQQITSKQQYHTSLGASSSSSNQQWWNDHELREQAKNKKS